MSRVRWKVLVAMVAVVSVTIGLSALFARRVTLAEIHRLTYSQRPPDIGPLAEHYRTHHGWSGVEQTIDAMPVRVVLTNAAREVIASSRDLRGMTIAIDADDRMRITGRGVGLVLQAPPLRVGDAYVYVLPARESPSDPDVTAGVSALDRGLIFTFAAATVVAMGLAFWVSRRITGPMERLTAAVDTMARGARPDHVPVTGRDEIARLATSFNAMADALARQEELRRRMVGDVAHELRTPLTNLRCELEAVQDGLVSPDTARIGSIHEEVLHLERIVADLQDLATADAGALQLRRERIDFADTVVRVVDAFARPRGIELKLELEEDVDANGDAIKVLADPLRIGQIVRNLMSNAARHARSVVRVRVSVDRGAREATVLVADDGPGIPAEHLSRVFERFYRVDEGRSREAGGAGLGLAIVKQLVELHEGRVWAENSDTGAVFTFAIPFISDS
jgi:signal transduction histidine kinase